MYLVQIRAASVVCAAVALAGYSQAAESNVSPAPSEWLLGPKNNHIDADTELTWSSDIFIAESGTRFERDWEWLRLDLDFTYARFDEDYEPFKEFDLFGFSEHLHEERYGGQGTLRPRIGERLTLIASGGAYDGYQDYRRVWLANYYRQRYANPRFPLRPGYKEPGPKGWNLAGGLRWEYLPERAFLELRGGYNVDDVVPGFIDDPATRFAVRGRETLYTRSLSASSENVLTSWLRLLNEFRVSDTTTRELRFSWQGSVNLALGERWVFRPYGGYTAENPKFEAFWAGSALEFEVTRHWTLIASGHYYADTGEVLDPAQLTTAAPGLESYSLALGVRFTWSSVTIKIEGGPYYTDYDAVLGASQPFRNLYRQRKWELAQASLSMAF